MSDCSTFWQVLVFHLYVVTMFAIVIYHLSRILQVLEKRKETP